MLYMEKETWAIRGAALEVHKELGCGFLEEVYQEAMERELRLSGIPFEPQKQLELYYKGELMTKYYKPDLICYGEIIVELKAVSEIRPEHKAQVINYLKATGKRMGMLINFGETSCKIHNLFFNK